MGQPRPLYFCLFVQKNWVASSIETRLVRVEGINADRQTTTTAQTALISYRASVQRRPELHQGDRRDDHEAVDEDRTGDATWNHETVFVWNLSGLPKLKTNKIVFFVALAGH